MKKTILIIFAFIFLFGNLISSQTTSSDDYQSDLVISGGGGNIDSDNYSNNAIIGQTSGKTSSDNYDGSLGFFYGIGSVISNTPPSNPNVSINSTSGNNYYNEDLNCFSIISDADNDILDVSVKWYEDNSVSLTQNFEGYESGSFFNSVLNSGNTSVGDVWRCEILLYDGMDYSSWSNSGNLTILNIPSSGSSTGGPGGGGGATISETYKFELDKDIIKKTIKQADTLREIVEITNTGNQELSLNISSENLKDFLVISHEKISISPGESKKVYLDFFAKEKERADAYTGRVIFDSGYQEERINVILEVQERKPLFDVITKVDNKVSPGELLDAKIKLINMGDLEDFDVLLSYGIKDFENNLVVSKNESLAIKNELDLVKEIEIPEDTAYGDYVFFATVSYDDVRAIGSETIKIVEKKDIYSFVVLIISLVFVVMLAILIILLRNKRHSEDVEQN